MTAFVLLALSTLPFAPSDDYSATWNRVQSAIESRYYARTTRGDEMKRLLAKYAPQAKAAHSRGEFENVVNAMIAEFHDSHFDFLTDDDQGYYLMDGLVRRAKPQEMPGIGAWFRRASDGYTVQMVLEDTEAAKAGLRKGDLVATVDGEPFSPVSALEKKVGQTVTLGFRRDGQSLQAKVKVEREPALQMFLDASRDSARVIERNGKKVGYFHLWTQANDDFRDALSNAVYGKLRNTDAFVLDLRDGFGGRPEGYGDPFFRPEVKLDWSTAPGQTMHQLYGYGRPLIVLINGGSRSAKEVLSYVLKKSGRATLVGSTTAGNVLGTSPERVNDWSYLEIPMVDLVTDGVRLEGKGVAPDVVVPQEFDAEGRDLALERALEIAAGTGVVLNAR